MEMTLAHMQLKVGTSEDRASCIIEMHKDGEPLGHIIYDASALDGFIRDIAKHRSHLTEQVTPTLDSFSRVEFVRDPAWKVPDRHNGQPETTLMALRHPGLGWLGFLLERNQALKLSEALREWSKPQPPDKSDS